MTKVPESATSKTPKVRVLLADDSPIILQSLRGELQQASWLEIVAEADNSQEAITLFFQLRPDVVVLSTCLRGQGGFEALRCIKRAFADCVAILTSRQPDCFIKEAGRLLGAAAVCCVSDRPTQLLKLLRRSTDKGSSSCC
jgi:DNA-binding NarL/FixJ family response regulator